MSSLVAISLAERVLIPSPLKSDMIAAYIEVTLNLNFPFSKSRVRFTEPKWGIK